MDIYQVVKDFGFEAFVAAILLLRIEPAIREQSKVLQDFKAVLLSLNGGSKVGEAFREAELAKQRVRVQEG